MIAELTRQTMRRPVSAIMMMATVLLLGAIAWQRLPLKFLPSVEAPALFCTIPYPGSTPEQVLNEIAIPAEGVFRTIPGIERLETVSNGSSCTVILRFGVDADMNTAADELRDRVERLKLRLPSQVDQVFIQRFNTNDLPVIVQGLFREGDMEAFAYRARKVLKARLGRIGGVAEVTVESPIPEREVLIEFDQDVLRSLHLDLSQLVGALQSSSINVGAGKIMEGTKTCIVRALGEFRSLDDIKNLSVGEQGLRLKDVAEVRFGAREEPMYVSLDGRPGILVMVRAEQQANVVSTCAKVREELERVMHEADFQGTQTRSFLDQGELIMSALNNLKKAGVSGALLAILVIFVFLHRIRPTLVVTLSIPASIVTALTFMYFSGLTLNLVTMVSLIIAVGMLVDDSIVVMENIMRHRQMGKSPAESSATGTHEVGMAIFASTAVTWVVFIPIIYMKAGTMSVFMSQLGVPLIVALGGSLVVALTVVPLGMSRFRPVSAQTIEWFEHLPGALAIERLARTLRPAQRCIHAYLYLMRLALTWRAATALVLVLLAAVTCLIPARNLGMREVNELDTREVRVQVQLDQNIDRDGAEAIFKHLTAQFDQWRDELGIKNVLNFHETASGAVEAYLYEETDDRPPGVPFLTTEKVQEIVAERLPKRIPGARITCDRAHSGSGQQGGSGLAIELQGDDVSTLRQVSAQLQQVIEKLPSVQEVRNAMDLQKMEIGVGIDEALALKAGTSPMAVARIVDAALRGARLTDMKYQDREIPVWAQFREQDRRSKANLDNVAVLGQTGTMVPLDQVVEYTKLPSPISIRRVNGKNRIALEITAKTVDLTALSNDLRRVLGQIELPLGYTAILGQQLQELQENVASFFAAMAMAILLVYLVMSAAFESFVLPLSVLSTIPLSMGGALWALYLTGTFFDVVTLIGCILMVGIIVKNGIVIVDHINQLYSQGMPRIDALVQAGRDRFRPVVMTATTTILGLVPLAMARSGGAVAFAGLGRALVGGMLVGTVLTLVVVPLFYSLLDDFRHWCTSMLASFLPRRKATPPPLPETVLP